MEGEYNERVKGLGGEGSFSKPPNPIEKEWKT